MEVWKNIRVEGLLPVYQVSSEGRIRRRKGVGFTQVNTPVFKGHNIFINNGNKYRVDRLVYQAFGEGQLYRGCKLRHIDGDPLNNRAGNLIREYPAIEKCKNGKVVKEYQTLKEAAEAEYMNVDTLKRILKGGKNYVSEYEFRYKDERPWGER